MEALERGDGLLTCREHPQLAAAIKREVAAGGLVRLHPGVVADSNRLDKGLRLRAACRWAPAGVLHSHTAVALWLQDSLPPVIHLACPTARAADGVEVTARRIPGSHVVSQGGVRVVNLAYAVAEVAAFDDGRAAQVALRKRLLAVPQLLAAGALLKGSPGNRTRRRVLRDFERNPWSFLERQLHTRLRTARITGWEANPPLWIAGCLVAPDIYFEAAGLVVELDGFAYHSAEGDFAEDRRRQNLFTLAGLRVLRFTYDEVMNEPQKVLATILQALRGPIRAPVRHLGARSGA